MVPRINYYIRMYKTKIIYIYMLSTSYIYQFESFFDSSDYCFLIFVLILDYNRVRSCNSSQLDSVGSGKMRFFLQLATNSRIENKLASCKEGVTRSATCELCWKLLQKVEPIQLFLQLATRQK